MKRFSIGTIIKVLLACLVVGWLLSLFGVTPDNFWQSIARLAQNLATTALNLLEGVWGYLLAGAAIVLPIYIAMLLYRRFKKG